MMGEKNIIFQLNAAAFPFSGALSKSSALCQKLSGAVNETERRQLMKAPVSGVQIYGEVLSDGQRLKSIRFRLPVIEEDMKWDLDGDEHVETAAGALADMNLKSGGELMLEVKDWTYEEFPEYTGCPAGAKRISTTGREVGIRYEKDVEYAVVDGIPLHLQILKPEVRSAPGASYPCVVYVQGSAWMRQDVYSGLVYLTQLVKRKYVIAVVEYRHSGQAHFPACIQDAKNAVRFMRKNAERFHVLPDQMILAGSSSGGHTSVFGGIVADGSEYDRNLFPGVSAEVKGIVDYYGSVSVMMEDGNPNTLNHMLPDSPEGMEMGGNLREDHELARKGSAVTYITPELNIPPCCILHGTKDFVVNPRQSVELYEKLRACGKEAWLYLIEGAMHGGPEFWTDEAADIVDRFMRSCFSR